MKKYFLAGFVMLPVLLIAQGKGIHFEHGLTWEQIKAKAKAEKKPVFIDCFTTWCGPCKYMSNNVFTDEKAGEFFNENFISLKLQLDTSAMDNEEVKSWYATAHELGNSFKVAYYPTFIFLNADGEPVHRIVGAADAAQFIEKSAKALQPETQYYTLLNKYKSGDKSVTVLYNLAQASLDAYEMEMAPGIANEYFDMQKDLYSKETLTLMEKVTMHSSDRGFNIMFNNPAQVDAVLGKGASATTTRNIIVQEDVAPYFNQQIGSGGAPDWDILYAMLNKKYGDRAGELCAFSRMLLFKESDMQDSLLVSIPVFMKSYAATLTPELTNSIAWTMFILSNDSTQLQDAAGWCKAILDADNNALYMDTYANLLYKAGQKDEAIIWEQKAVDKAAGTIQGLQENLDKMKSGEKTWQDQ